jgi:ESCRT-I complex subunit TSG101
MPQYQLSYQQQQQQQPQYHPQQQYQQQPQQYARAPQPPQPQPQPPQPPQPPLNLLDDNLTTTTAPPPAPPIPPNPEKDALLSLLSTSLVTHIRTTVSTNTRALAPLIAQQSALQTAFTRLQTELSELRALDAALESNTSLLGSAMRDADAVISAAAHRQAPDVDDVLVAPTVVGGQLYAVAAEERGIADALFVLGRALDKGRIGVDVFVRQSRVLAREAFLKKALLRKIARGMGIDEVGMR